MYVCMYHHVTPCTQPMYQHACNSLRFDSFCLSDLREILNPRGIMRVVQGAPNMHISSAAPREEREEQSSMEEKQQQQKKHSRGKQKDKNKAIQLPRQRSFTPLRRIYPICVVGMNSYLHHCALVASSAPLHQPARRPGRSDLRWCHVVR
jgi:hypothetical protein